MLAFIMPLLYGVILGVAAWWIRRENKRMDRERQEQRREREVLLEERERRYRLEDERMAEHVNDQIEQIKKRYNL